MPSPSKQDYITQIEADQQASLEDPAVLSERLELVREADEESVREVYMNHVRQSLDLGLPDVP